MTAAIFHIDKEGKRTNQDINNILHMVEPRIREGIKVIVDIVPAICNCYQIWLFGSQAKGKANSSSDVDIYIVIYDDDKDHSITGFKIYKQFYSKKMEIAAQFFFDFKSYFEEMSYFGDLAREVKEHGILIYELS